MVTYARSILAPEGVRELVGAEYGLEVGRCRLVRSLANDVYEIEAGGRFALKVYRQSMAPGAHTLAEVAWEQDLATALLRAGLQVPLPVPLVRGELAGLLDAPEGPRPYALTTWVDGPKPTPPWTDALYREFGRLTASFHLTASAFSSPYARREIEPLSSLWTTATEVADHLGGQDRELVLTRAEGAIERLDGLASGLTWGVRHGDVSLDNVHVTGRRLSLHDFDRSGPGWLIRDLTGVESTPHGQAFRDGYQEISSLTDADRHALPQLTVVDLIANLRFHLVDKPLVFGSESRGEGWVERELQALREPPELD